MRLPFAILGYAHDKEDVQAAIDAATRLGELQIRKGYAPLWWESRARYARENHETLPGVERIQLPEELDAMGRGDCDDHAPMLAASLRTIGRRARAVVIDAPGVGYHVIVRTEDAEGRPLVIDPSARRGMLDRELGEVGASRARRKFGASIARASTLLEQAARLNPYSAAARALTSEASRLLRSAKQAATAEDTAEEEGAEDGAEERG